MQQKNKNREIRVFLSSTFRDMQFERDYLIKNIFPEVRQACRERLVEFTEIDLRWGVTKEESEQGKVVRICLEEIDRCRPYFLGFMGARYGWEPAHTDLFHMDELVQLFPLVAPSIKAKKSVTEMEILHGVLESPKMVGHAFFYIRDQALTEQLAQKSGTPADYYDTSDSSNAKLLDLKSRVKGSGFPFHENYTDLEAMGAQVKADLLAVLDHLYPQEKTPTPLEAERMTHEAYAADRCQAYLPSPKETGALDAYIQSRKQSGNTTPLIIGGHSGLGKSALLAYWLSTYRQTHPDSFLIQHYAGVSGDATPLAILRRIMLEIKARNQDADEVPTKPEDIVKDFPLWLAKVRDRDPLLLVIDAVNQIEGDNLNWLPSFILPNVTLIVSALPGPHYDQLYQRGWQTHAVQPLDNERRHQLIQNYLHKSYSKKLSEAQISTIAAAPQSANPLFLITLLEELRVFGVFEKLDALIEGYLQAPDPATLFAKVLQRMEVDYRDKNDQSTLIPIVKAIWAARKGLTETELLGITGLNRQDLSIVLLAMDYHLSSKTGLRNFFHDYLRQAVRALYLNSEPEQQVQHRLLAEYFDRQPFDARKADELPWQWLQAKEDEKLKDCLVSVSMFKRLYCDDRLALLGYWLSMKDRYDIGACYLESYDECEELGLPMLEFNSYLSEQLGSFLMNECASFHVAEVMLRRSLEIREEFLGSDDLVTSNSIENLANLLVTKGDIAEAESLYRRVLEIRRNILGVNNRDVAGSLSNLAKLLRKKGDMFGAEDLSRQAMEIRERILDVDDPDVADSLIEKASLLRLNGELVVAESLYRRALSIQEKAFGSDHPKVAACLNDLALLLRDKGDIVDAETFFRRALSIEEISLGADHPDVAACLNNLAFLLEKKGESFEAESLYRRTLSIQEKAFGSDHPDVADCLSNLAIFLEKKGELFEAELLMRRALAIQEKAFGSNHPTTAAAINNLGRLREKNRDPVEAEQLYRRALAIREQVLGLNHLDTVASLICLANLLNENGNAAAEQFYRRALEVRANVLGYDSWDKAESINSLAILLKNKGEIEEAESLFRQALNICVDVLGYDHPETARSLFNLAKFLVDNGNANAAEPLYQQALTIRERVLGPNHPNTVITRTMLKSIRLAKWLGSIFMITVLLGVIAGLVWYLHR